MRLLILSFVFCCLSNFIFSNHLIIDVSVSVLKNAQNPLSHGDTIFLEPGIRGKLSIWGYQGSSFEPIILMNLNGTTIINSSQNYCLDFYNCNQIQINGSNNGNYGIVIDGNSVAEGLRLLDGSQNFEITGVEIKNTNVGIKAKSQLSRDIFLLNGLNIHHNYIHDINTEGMYIGSSFYHTSNDHLLQGVDIHDNIIERTGWDGIQVGSTTTDCKIYNNTIREDSYSNVSGQQSGIMINPGSDCDCYNNKIIDGYGPGIFYQGNGGSEIYNNLIVNAGKNSLNTVPRGGDGIAVWGGQNRWWSYGNNVYIYHNTIVKPMNNGITFAFEPGYQGDSSEIFNNLILEPLGQYYSDSNKSYIETYLNADYFSGGNYVTHHWSDQWFRDTIMYIPFSSAPFIDYCTISFGYGDMNLLTRDSSPDSGAHEYGEVSSNREMNNKSSKSVFYPNPVVDFLNRDPGIILEEINIFNLQGDLVFKEFKPDFSIDIEHLSPGIYLLSYYTSDKMVLEKIVKI